MGIKFEPGKKLEYQITMMLMASGVEENQIDASLKWAFGKDAWTINVCDWPKRWNKLHGRIFEAKKDEKFVEFIAVVGYFYTEYLKWSLQNLGKN